MGMNKNLLPVRKGKFQKRVVHVVKKKQIMRAKGLGIIQLFMFKRKNIHTYSTIIGKFSGVIILIGIRQSSESLYAWS